MKISLEKILSAFSLRRTSVRLLVLEYLIRSKYPVAPSEIFIHVSKEKPGVAESTVYRELHTLFEKQVVRKTYLFDERESYELAMRDHHHHVTCQDCNDIQDVESDELEEVLGKLQAELESGTIFRRITHHLEFRGVCTNCEKA